MENKIKINLKNALILFLSIFVTFSVNMNMESTTGILSSFNGNSILWVVVFLLIYWLLKEIANINNKRLAIICIILGIIFASFEIVGYSINIYDNLEGIISSTLTIEKAIIKWLGYAIIIYAIIFKLFIILEKRNIESYKINKGGKSLFFSVWAIIFVLWIPFFLNYFPGILSIDSIVQISQGLGLRVLTNHHPVFHTFLITILMNIGKIFGNYNIGIALYSIIQMLGISAIFSAVILYMLKRNVNKKIVLLSFVFYAFYPVNALYSITMWKDIPFAISILIFTVMMAEISINKESFIKSKLKVILLFISMLLVILFKNNGIYVVIITMPFIFIFMKQNYKQLTAICMAVLMMYVLWKGPVFKIFNIEDGSPREALSIPLQQFARISKYHSDTLSQEEKNEIYKYVTVDNIGELYYPRISDPLKNHFNNENFAKDKIGFLKLWVKLCIKYPRAAIESFLCGSYGYWYPETTSWIACREVAEADADKEKERELDLKSTQIVNLKIIEKYDSLLDRRDLPLNSMIYSIGFAFWILLTIFMYSIYKKQYNIILMYIPTIVIWLTCLASPVFAEFRYAYSIFICLPILIGMNLRKNNIDE